MKLKNHHPNDAEKRTKPIRYYPSHKAGQKIRAIVLDGPDGREIHISRKMAKRMAKQTLALLETAPTFPHVSPSFVRSKKDRRKVKLATAARAIGKAAVALLLVVGLAGCTKPKNELDAPQTEAPKPRFETYGDGRVCTTLVVHRDTGRQFLVVSSIWHDGGMAIVEVAPAVPAPAVPQ